MERCAARFLRIVEPLLAKQAGDAVFTRLGSFRFENDPVA